MGCQGGAQLPQHLLKHRGGEGVEQVEAVGLGRYRELRGVGQRKGRLGGDVGRVAVAQGALVEPPVALHPQGTAAGLVGQVEPHASLAAAVVYEQVALAHKAAVGQTFEYRVRGGLVGVVVLVGVGLVAAGGTDAQQGVHGQLGVLGVCAAHQRASRFWLWPGACPAGEKPSNLGAMQYAMRLPFARSRGWTGTLGILRLPPRRGGGRLQTATGVWACIAGNLCQAIYLREW